MYIADCIHLELHSKNFGGTMLKVTSGGTRTKSGN
jgi:hypothetical protein